MKKVFFLFSFTVFSACLNCQSYVDNVFRKKENYFSVEEKYMKDQKMYTLVGAGVDFEKDTFSEVGFSDLYNIAEVGDSLLKRYGEAEVILIRNGKSFSFPLECR